MCVVLRTSYRCRKLWMPALISGVPGAVPFQYLGMIVSPDTAPYVLRSITARGASSSLSRPQIPARSASLRNWRSNSLSLPREPENQSPRKSRGTDRRFAPPGSPPGGFLSDLPTFKEADDRVRATDARYAFIVLGAVLDATNLPHDLAASWLDWPRHATPSQPGRPCQASGGWACQPQHGFQCDRQARDFLRAKEPDCRVRSGVSGSGAACTSCAFMSAIWRALYVFGIGQLPRCPDHSRD